MIHGLMKFMGRMHHEKTADKRRELSSNACRKVLVKTPGTTVRTGAVLLLY